MDPNTPTSSHAEKYFSIAPPYFSAPSNLPFHPQSQHSFLTNSSSGLTSDLYIQPSTPFPIQTNKRARQGKAPNPNKCRGCRTSKKGCDGVKPTCERCERRGIECVYEAAAEGRATARDGSYSLHHSRDHTATKSIPTDGFADNTAGYAPSAFNGTTEMSKAKAEQHRNTDAMEVDMISNPGPVRSPTLSTSALSQHAISDSPHPVPAPIVSQPSKQAFRPPNRSCQQCRAQHRGCDGKRPVCSRCADSNKQCTYPDSTAPMGDDVGLPLRDKPAREQRNPRAFCNIENSDRRADSRNDGIEDMDVEEDVLVVPSSTWRKESARSRPATTRNKASAHKSRPKAKTKRTKKMIDTDDSEDYEYVEYSTETAKQLLEQEASAALAESHLDEEEILLEKPDREGHDTCFRLIEFADVEFQHLPLEVQDEWRAIATRVYNTLHFSNELADGESNDDKRTQLLELVMELRKMQDKAQKHGAQELVIGLGKLVATVRLFHDFYEHFGRCVGILGRLGRVLDT